jgi:multidrug efflux pump subunit AcrB
MLAPTFFGVQFCIIALVGMTLPIGVATKNAIPMIDSAPLAQRDDGTEPREAIFHAVVV